MYIRVGVRLDFWYTSIWSICTCRHTQQMFCCSESLNRVLQTSKLPSPFSFRLTYRDICCLAHAVPKAFFDSKHIHRFFFSKKTLAINSRSNNHCHASPILYASLDKFASCYGIHWGTVAIFTSDRYLKEIKNNTITHIGSRSYWQNITCHETNRAGHLESNLL